MPEHTRSDDDIHYSLKKEINEYYWSVAIKSFAVSLVGLFGPIYVFLYFDQSVINTMLFYLPQYIAIVLLVPIAVHTLEKWGLKKSMAIGNPILSIYLLCLMLAGIYGFTFIILAAIARVLHIIFFFPARHADFAKFASSKKMGQQVGTANIIATAVRVLAPLFGGLIIVNFGFTPLFIIASVLIFISMLPLFFSPEIYEHYSFSYLQTFAFPFKKENWRTSIAFFFEGMEVVIIAILFSIFIYTVIGNFETIGWVVSASSLLLIFFIYFMGWLIDKKGNKKILSITSVINSIAWIVNAFIATPFQYLIYSSVYKLTETGTRLPFNSLFYKNAHKKKHGADEYIIYHEVVLNTGRAVMCLIVITGFYFGITAFLPYFMLAAFSVLMFRLVK